MSQPKPRLFAELCARLASVSLCLQGGRVCRPPVSTPGAKTGYAPTILALAGLRPGDGSDAYLWCEPEAGPRSVLQSYPDQAALRSVADEVRAWIGRDARGLYDELLQEHRAGASAHPARWLALSYLSFASKPGAGFKATAGGGWPDAPPSLRNLRLPVGVRWPVVGVADDARRVDPRDVARWLLLCRWSFSGKGPDHGYGGPGSVVNTATANWTTEQRDAALERPRLAAQVSSLVREWPPVLVAADGRDVEPDGDLEGAVVYIDGSYQDTTPYQHNLTREEQVALARRWADAGATVLVSERESVAQLNLPGWEAVRIDGERRSQARTFGSTEEWVTMNRVPVERPSTQTTLFPVTR